MSATTMTTLVRVEIRKATDTRAGFWLLVTLGLVSAAIAVLLLIFGTPDELTFETFLLTAQLPMGILLPVVAILAVTSEWSQRTALTTFTLVPRRSRVVTAKIIALVAVALLAVAASAAVAVVANVLGMSLRDGAGDWGDLTMLGEAALFQLISVLVGVGLGMLLLSAPQAIVAYLLAPLLLTILVSLISALEEVSRWIDLTGTTTMLLGEELDGQTWARIGVSFALWALLPLALGVLRVQRKEVH